jgi:hypothetical protein
MCGCDGEGWRAAARTARGPWSAGALQGTRAPRQIYRKTFSEVALLSILPNE